MAVAVPIVGAFMAVDAGIAAIGAATTALGTFAAFAEVAGGILLGVGALTGKHFRFQQRVWMLKSVESYSPRGRV